ncbi:L-lysine exporter family protein LysE/ArgO [Paenarthrobacter nicotinovorans]|uniref:LysE/ArgO family amino acid transporter n=1 Tax=Micrococcaceae TaxID=1268 RepID=UPI0004793B90|nr:MULTISPECIES: LysE family transporter [Micrococcaceae]MDR6436886.1 L-lysine exporter family protein LysE/ArgO [Paenarthrobacter nicotinovorans]BCW57656.1 amino acid transporter [Arthrobacter sp. StoSoilB20]SCZ55395.1 L-lysine exporter family protein LysE/ArgO [Arthrobacter sp. UNCCL28]
MNYTDFLQSAGLGLATGLALIVAIGAQNAFVLRQGIRGEHIVPIVAVCALSDAVLIAAGVLGTGALITAAPAAVVVLRYVGAAFLVTYGVLAARRALRPQALTTSEGSRNDGGAKRGAAAAVTTVLALTWLNPHVYLDIALLGSIASAQGTPLQWWFGAGAMLGSILWFCSLGFGARFLRGFFARPRSWRFLDGGIAVTMVALGAGLALGA